mmetsp:Transcript_18492/g.65811  ORF Transcript_18492/g.65811 Transcript_18492/m.65811 type:complete len:272 (+) Transcript_18492:416-1231(+)
MAPTMAPLPAHSCASVRCVTASILVAMNLRRALPREARRPGRRRLRLDALAARVFVDAELRVLDLVVVDVPVEADDDGADVVVVLDDALGRHVRLLLRVRRAADVLHANKVELLLDADLADDVHLLASRGELGLLEVRGRGERAGEDLLGLHLETEAVKLFLVAGAGLRRVVRHEEDALPQRAQLVEDGGHFGDEGVSLPDDAVAVEDEDVDRVEELRGVGQLLGRGELTRLLAAQRRRRAARRAEAQRRTREHRQRRDGAAEHGHARRAS